MQMANMGVEEALSKAGGNRKELFPSDSALSG